MYQQRQSDDDESAELGSSSGRGSEGRCATSLMSDELDERARKLVAHRSSSLIARARSSHDAPSPYYAEYAFRCDLTKHEILYHRVKWSLEKAVALGRADIL